MFAATRLAQLKSSDPNFFCKNLQKVIEDLFKNFCISLGPATSCICLLKSQRIASSVPFIVIELIKFLSQ